MSITIRPFRNTDTVTICEIWNGHHFDYGPTLPLRPQHLELMCLAKPAFEPQQLLLAEVDGKAVGFMQIVMASESDLSGDATKPEADNTLVHANIAALCVMPRDDEAEIAAVLLGEAIDLMKALGATSCQFRPPLPDAYFFIGLGPGDSIAGVTASEQRVCRWITDSGFRPSIPISLWELDLSTFQPPIDRIQMQIRRSAHVDRQIEEPQLPWWLACVLGHTEPTAFQLTHRLQRRVLGEVLLWTITPELQVVPEIIYWLWPMHLSKEEGMSDQQVFLLAESMRALQQEGVDLVRTVSAANENGTNLVLKRIGFRPVQSGVLFELTF